ncbi:2913_t:CDS:2 [Funneliformis caledonium]|uniref:2913_t:CDS:1 n=1 Tax=Funneliformis caledonium TaxID=1117310 RepID=A0A9N9G1H6_9GLOM|nr:2913_t:CDS:2 [Funneliformis caledonium]
MATIFDEIKKDKYIDIILKEHENAKEELKQREAGEDETRVKRKRVEGEQSSVGEAELLISHTPYEFHDTRKSPINDPTAKIDFIITELVVVIEGKGNINNTTSHKEAIGQVCDRHMEILKQQRLRKFIFDIVLDCRQMKIIKTIHHTTPSFLYYQTGLLSLFTNAGTQAEKGYALWSDC